MCQQVATLKIILKCLSCQQKVKIKDQDDSCKTRLFVHTNINCNIS